MVQKGKKIVNFISVFLNINRANLAFELTSQ